MKNVVTVVLPFVLILFVRAETRAENIDAVPGYVIITTSAISAASGELSRFVAHKESLSFNVQIVTEANFGGGVGDTAAKNIRRWLRNHYISDNIKYVLLIGNPRPDSGEIPMKMVWTSAWSEGVPSDFYYADLTGSWDWNGDGRYGMRPEDCGPGGVDTFYEVSVGRIPYYGSICNRMAKECPVSHT
jgi:hypothetical protein